MTNRQRLSATVEADVLKAGRRAVAEGRAKNLSTWVNEALRRHAENDSRLKAMGEAVRAYEREFGVITEDDIRKAERHFRARTIKVRPRAPGRQSGRPQKRGVA